MICRERGRYLRVVMIHEFAYNILSPPASRSQDVLDQQGTNDLREESIGENTSRKGANAISNHAGAHVRSMFSYVRMPCACLPAQPGLAGSARKAYIVNWFRIFTARWTIDGANDPTSFVLHTRMMQQSLIIEAYSKPLVSQHGGLLDPGRRGVSRQ
jgi:hypothetical protein